MSCRHCAECATAPPFAAALCSELPPTVSLLSSPFAAACCSHPSQSTVSFPPVVSLASVVHFASQCFRTLSATESPDSSYRHSRFSRSFFGFLFFVQVTIPH